MEKTQLSNKKTNPTKLRKTKERNISTHMKYCRKMLFGPECVFLSFCIGNHTEVWKKWSVSQHKPDFWWLKNHAQVILLLPPSQPLSLLGSAESDKRGNCLTSLPKFSPSLIPEVIQISTLTLQSLGKQISQILSGFLPWTWQSEFAFCFMLYLFVCWVPKCAQFHCMIVV